MSKKYNDYQIYKRIIKIFISRVCEITDTHKKPACDRAFIIQV
jgi:hypothetical protein